MLVVFGQQYEFRQMIRIILLTGIISIITVSSGLSFIMCGWMFIVAGKEMEFNRIVKLAYLMLIVAIALVVLQFMAGQIEEYTMYRNNLLRHSWGFSHPNTFALRLFQLAVCHCYLRWKKIGFLDIGFLLTLIYIIVVVTDSRTATICTVTLLITVLFLKIMERKYSAFQKVMGNILWIAGIIAALMSLTFTYLDVGINKFLMTVDKLVSYRFSWGHKVYKMSGVSLFGQKILVSANERKEAGLSGRFWLDSAYANLCLRTGLVMLILFVVVYFYTFYKFRHIPIIAAIMFIYAVYGVMEMGLIMLTHNVFLLLLVWTMYPQKSFESLLPVEKPPKVRFIYRRKAELRI
jgi:hypothetical protein